MSRLDGQLSIPGAVVPEQPVDGLSQAFGLPETEMTLRFRSSGPENVSVARAAVVFYLRSVFPKIAGDISQDTVDSAELCTSEVVTDAIKHTDRLTHVRVLARAGLFAVSVGSGIAEDGGSPHVNESVPDDSESGRGLMIVEACSKEWGYTKVDPTKTSDLTATETWFVMETAA